MQVMMMRFACVFQRCHAGRELQVTRHVVGLGLQRWRRGQGSHPPGHWQCPLAPAGCVLFLTVTWHSQGTSAACKLTEVERSAIRQELDWIIISVRLSSACTHSQWLLPASFQQTFGKKIIIIVAGSEIVSSCVRFHLGQRSTDCCCLLLIMSWIT